MKKILLSLGFFTLALSGAYAQVGIGTLDPNASAQLDITATDRGVLIPRVALTSTTDATTITNGNIESLLVYATTKQADITPGYYYWYDGKWNRVLNSADVTNIINVLGSKVTGLTKDGGNLKLTQTNGDDVTIPIADLNIVTTLVKAAGNNGQYTYTNERGDSTEITVVQDVVNNITNSTEIKNLINELIKNAAPNFENGNNTTVEGDGTTATPYKINVANADGNTTLGVVKAADTDPIVTVANGVLGFDADNVALSGGDLGGTLATPSIDKLQGKDLNFEGANAPTNGKVLTFDGTDWIAKEPAKVKATDLDNKGALSVGNGLEFPSGDGSDALLKDVTVNVKAGKGIKTDATDGISVDFENGLEFSSDKLAVKQGNGITVDADGVNLGGTLTKDAEIITTGGGLVIKGNNAGTVPANVKIKLDNKVTPEADDKLVIVGSDGALKSVDPLSVGKIEYSRDEKATGRKWAVDGVDKNVYEKTIKVEFENKTYAEVANKIPADAIVIGVRLQRVNGNDQEVFSSAVYKKDTKRIYAAYGQMSWTLNGTYNAIVEYYY